MDKKLMFFTGKSHTRSCGSLGFAVYNSIALSAKLARPYL